MSGCAMWAHHSHATKCACFVSLSINVRMVLFPCVEVGGPFMKSIDLSSHGLAGAGSWLVQGVVDERTVLVYLPYCAGTPYRLERTLNFLKHTLPCVAGSILCSVWHKFRHAPHGQRTDRQGRSGEVNIVMDQPGCTISVDPLLVSTAFLRFHLSGTDSAKCAIK